MDDLRDELHDAIAKAEQAFADDVTAAMAKRAAAMAKALETNKKAHDTRMAAFNGVTPVKEPIVRNKASEAGERILADILDPLPSIVRRRSVDSTLEPVNG